MPYVEAEERLQEHLRALPQASSHNAVPRTRSHIACLANTEGSSVCQHNQWFASLSGDKRPDNFLLRSEENDSELISLKQQFLGGKEQIAWLGNRKVFRMAAGHQTAFRFRYILTVGNRIQLQDCPKIFTNLLLTPWSRVLVETLTGLQLDKKFPAFYRTRTFLTALCSYFVTSRVCTVRSCWHLPQHHKLVDQPLPVVRDCLFNMLAATLQIGDRSSIRNLRTRHAAVTGTRLSNTQTSTLLNSSLQYS